MCILSKRSCKGCICVVFWYVEYEMEGERETRSWLKGTMVAQFNIPILRTNRYQKYIQDPMYILSSSREKFKIPAFTEIEPMTAACASAADTKKTYFALLEIRAQFFHFPIIFHDTRAH